MGCGPLVRNAATSFGGGAAGPRDAAGGPLTPTEWDQMRLEYGRPRGDERVLRLLDEVERLEAALAGALERAEEAEARLTRRVRHQP